MACLLVLLVAPHHLCQISQPPSPCTLTPPLSTLTPPLPPSLPCVCCRLVDGQQVEEGWPAGAAGAARTTVPGLPPPHCVYPPLCPSPSPRMCVCCRLVDGQQADEGLPAGAAGAAPYYPSVPRPDVPPIDYRQQQRQQQVRKGQVPGGYYLQIAVCCCFAPN